MTFSKNKISIDSVKMQGKKMSLLPENNTKTLPRFLRIHDFFLRM